MDFRWRITSRTGDTCEGEDNFPSPEQRGSANAFELFLPYGCKIVAPYGQEFVGDNFYLAVPDDKKLIFKRRVRVDLCDGEEQRTFTYILAFEPLEVVNG